MAHSVPKFGPTAQTCEQRAGILRQMLAYYAQIRRKLPLHAHALHQRYVAGELSWPEMCALRDLPSALPSRVELDVR